MPSSEPPRIERVHCNECGHDTKHSLVATRTHRGSEEVAPRYEITWCTVYDMIECCGCESVTLRSTLHFSEWGPDEREVNYYPPRSARRLPNWYNDLPSDIVALLQEVYSALHADSRRLSMMGARALIDMIILDQVGDAGSFSQKLSKLESEGFLGKKNREVLEAALDVGSAASHRGHRPNTKHVQHVMDIVENLLHASILEPIAKELMAYTPKRGQTNA